MPRPRAASSTTTSSTCPRSPVREGAVDGQGRLVHLGTVARFGADCRAANGVLTGDGPATLTGSEAE